MFRSGSFNKQHTGLKEQPLGAFSLSAHSHWIEYLGTCPKQNPQNHRLQDDQTICEHLVVLNVGNLYLRLAFNSIISLEHANLIIYTFILLSEDF